MNITTRSAIDISESLAGFLFASYLNSTHGYDPRFEKRMKYVDTAKYTIADLYISQSDVAIEAKSVEHGTSAIKGVVQSSIYKEQASKSILLMQKPRRRNLRDAIESFSETTGVGVVWITGVPVICSEDTIKRATGGNAKPFEIWKQDRYSTTKAAIVNKSMTDWVNEYIDTLEQVVSEKSDSMFEFAVEPDSDVDGFFDLF